MYHIFFYALISVFAVCSSVQSADLKVLKKGDVKSTLSGKEYETKLAQSKNVAQAANQEALSKAQGLKKGRLRRKPGVEGFLPILSTAVIVVDIQRDFIEQPFNGNPKGGSLAVGNTRKDYTDAAAEFLDALRNDKCLIAFTQDWHPERHVSFASRWDGGAPFNLLEEVPLPGHTQPQMLWPDHCVQGRKGAEILVPVKDNDIVVKKGMNLDFDSYSGFEDKNGTKTAMEQALDTLGVKNLIVIGIATDYCVKDTVIDALKLKKSHKKNKYNVYLITNLCRGVAPDTSKAAFKKMQDAGAILYWINDLDEGASRETLKELQEAKLTIHVAKNLQDFLQKTGIKPSLLQHARKARGGS